MKVPEKKGGMDEINITPLIDVVLVLLIIFMVLTPITVQTMASRLPPEDVEAEPPPPDQVPDQLMIAVYEDGTLALNLAPQTDEAMRTTLEARLKSKAKKTVFIDAHKQANYARVIQIMDMAREVGAENIGFAEMTEEGPAKLAPGTSLPVPGAPAAPPGEPMLVAPPGLAPSPG